MLDDPLEREQIYPFKPPNPSHPSTNHRLSRSSASRRIDAETSRQRIEQRLEIVRAFDRRDERQSRQRDDEQPDTPNSTTFPASVCTTLLSRIDEMHGSERAVAVVVEFARAAKTRPRADIVPSEIREQHQKLAKCARAGRARCLPSGSFPRTPAGFRCRAPRDRARFRACSVRVFPVTFSRSPQ